MLRNAASLTLVDELGTQPQLVLLAVLLFLCLLRGVTERREWRMWAALYIAAVWVQAFWGLPTTPAGEVSRWDMPGCSRPASPCSSCRMSAGTCCGRATTPLLLICSSFCWPSSA